MKDCVMLVDHKQIKCEVKNRPKCKIEETVDSTGNYKIIGVPQWQELEIENFNSEDLWIGKKDVTIKFEFKLPGVPNKVIETWHLSNCECVDSKLKYDSVSFY